MAITPAQMQALASLPRDHLDFAKIPKILRSKDPRYFTGPSVLFEQNCFTTALYNAQFAYRKLGLHVVVGSLGIGKDPNPFFEFGGKDYKTVAEFKQGKPAGFFDCHVWLEDVSGKYVWDAATANLLYWVAPQRQKQVDFKPRELIEGLTHQQCASRGLHYVPAPKQVQIDIMNDFWSHYPDFLIKISCATAYPFTSQHLPLIPSGGNSPTVASMTDKQRSDCRKFMESKDKTSCTDQVRKAFPQCADFCRERLVELTKPMIASRMQSNVEFTYNLFYTSWASVEVKLSFEDEIRIIVNITTPTNRVVPWSDIISANGWIEHTEGTTEETKESLDRRHPQFAKFPNHIHHALARFVGKSGKSNGQHLYDNCYMIVVSVDNNSGGSAAASSSSSSVFITDKYVNQCFEINDAFMVDSRSHFVTSLSNTLAKVYTNESLIYMQEIFSRHDVPWPRASAIEGHIQNLAKEIVYLKSGSSSSSSSSAGSTECRIILHSDVTRVTIERLASSTNGHLQHLRDFLSALFETENIHLPSRRSITWNTTAYNMCPILRAAVGIYCEEILQFVRVK